MHSDAPPVPVLHLVDCLNPGGTETQLLGQLRHTDRRRWRPMVGAFHEGGILLGDVQAMDVPVEAFPLHSSLAHPNTALQVARIALHARKHGVRLIHAHDFYSNLVGVAAARLAGAKVIASRRDLAHWLGAMQKRALGVACRAADRVVANARSVAEVDDPALTLDQASLRVVPNGLDLARFDALAAVEPEPAPGLSEVLADPERRARSLAVVSNMNLPAKGQADLLEAAAQLASQGLLLELLLVGDGAERPRLEEQARALGIASRTHFLGRRRDVPALLARAHAACQPSWAEGFPNAVMEAMAASRPVVATAVGGCPELVTDGVDGLLVPPRQPAELASALGRLYADEQAACDLGRRARDTIATRYSLASAAAAFDALYAELCPETDADA